MEDVAVEDARAIVLQAAGDLDINMRARALATLIRTVAEPAGGDIGPRGSWDPNPWVQRAVVHALEDRLPEPESEALLLELVKREGADPYSRGLAARALARAGKPAPLEVLQGCVAAHPDWKAAPCALAAAAQGDEDARAQVEGYLREGELPLQLGFIEELGRSGIEELAPAVEEALGLVEEPLRLPLAGALLHLAPAKGQPTFRDALASDELELRLEAVDLLASNGSDAALELLRRAASGESFDARYARLTLVALGHAPLSEAIEATQDEDIGLRLRGLWALGQGVARVPAGKDRRAVKDAFSLLDGASRSDELMVRVAGIDALAAARSPESVAGLRALMTEEGTEVAFEAGVALCIIGAGRDLPAGWTGAGPELR